MIDDIGKRILLPYAKLYSGVYKGQCARFYLTGGYNSYIYFVDKIWHIVSYDVPRHCPLEYKFVGGLFIAKGDAFTANCGSLEEAKLLLDEKLIEAGCKLLNTTEEADKYRALL